MSIETSHGFRSAQAAWENANPYDGDCACEGVGFECEVCGELSDVRECPDTSCTESMRELAPEEIAEHFPNQSCPVHGWCTGCSSPRCEDCNG